MVLLRLVLLLHLHLLLLVVRCRRAVAGVLALATLIPLPLAQTALALAVEHLVIRAVVPLFGHPQAWPTVHARAHEATALLSVWKVHLRLVHIMHRLIMPLAMVRKVAGRRVHPVVRRQSRGVAPAELLLLLLLLLLMVTNLHLRHARVLHRMRRRRVPHMAAQVRPVVCAAVAVATPFAISQVAFAVPRFDGGAYTSRSFSLPASRSRRSSSSYSSPHSNYWPSSCSTDRMSSSCPPSTQASLASSTTARPR